MFNKRTLVIVKRELKTRLFSRSFIIMTLLIPIFLLGIIGFQTFLATYESDKDTKLIVVSESGEIIKLLAHDFGELPFIKKGYYSIAFDSLQKTTIHQFVNSKKGDLLSSKLTGIIYVPDSALTNKRIQYYSPNPNNGTVFNKLKVTLNQVLIDEYFKDKKLSAEEITFARTNVDFEGYRITKEEKIEEEGYGNIIVSFLFTFFLYFSLLMIGTMLMRAVVEEKATKIIEVLLSSVNSTELMTGKILGAAITGVLQMAIWLLPIVILVTTSWFALPPDFAIKLDVSLILFFLYNYFVSLVTFLGLFAAIGAMFDNDQDAQSGIWPVMMLIMIPFFISIGMQQNPENTIAKIASILPFASLIVMPARMTLIAVPVLQVIVSVLVNFFVMISVFYFSGKIYRVGILMTGKKPGWQDVIKWLRYKY